MSYLVIFVCVISITRSLISKLVFAILVNVFLISNIACVNSIPGCLINQLVFVISVTGSLIINIVFAISVNGCLISTHVYVIWIPMSVICKLVFVISFNRFLIRKLMFVTELSTANTGWSFQSPGVSSENSCLSCHRILHYQTCYCHFHHQVSHYQTLRWRWAYDTQMTWTLALCV